MMTARLDELARSLTGRALDEAVAIAIDEVRYDVVIAGCSRGGRMCGSIENAEAYRAELVQRGHDVGAIVLHDSVPAYSDNIADAFEALQTLVAKGARVSVHNRAVGPWACHVIMDIGSADERVFFEYGETPEVAICYAILAVSSSVVQSRVRPSEGEGR